ncbi:hypothetical protein V6L77_01325 [Pannonibacter sp. Pt2-lr]
MNRLSPARAAVPAADRAAGHHCRPWCLCPREAAQNLSRQLYDKTLLAVALTISAT